MRSEKVLDLGAQVGNNYCVMPKRTKKSGTRTMTDLLREALAECETLTEVQRATGVKRQALAKFRRGEQSLRLDLADKLAAYFGIESKRKAQDRGTNPTP